jgi:tRNA(Ile)-lysidine synthase
VQDLPRKVRAYIDGHQLLKAGVRVGIAVSGGVDSVALLRLLLDLRKELGIVLSVVHLNHKLRGADSDADERFVAELAQAHKLELHCDSGDVAAHASTKRLGTEAAGRELRYQFFWKLLETKKLDRVATAHTIDDQAETVLLRLVRGAGTRGLAGIYPQLSDPGSQFSDTPSIIRPLLGARRVELESYLTEIGQAWREDQSNRDLRYSRNRVRHGIMPRLERGLNPSVREALAEVAEIARDEEAYWRSEVGKVLPQLWNKEAKKLELGPFLELPLAMQRRVLRAAAESLDLRLEFAHVGEILVVASGAEKAAGLPGNWLVRRENRELTFVPPQSGAESTTDYEYVLPIPGRIEVPEAGAWFEATLVQRGAKAGYNRGHSFDPALLATELKIRNWRAGDRFWPAHTKSPKKIKELLQEKHVTGPERQRTPVIVSGDQVVWLRGFLVPASLQPVEDAVQAVLIQEFPLAPSSAP